VEGEDIQQLVWYTFKMFKLAFASHGADGTDSTQELDNTIKLFLTLYTELDTAVYGRSETEKPAYLEKYNLSSLLRLPQQIKHFTRLRYSHEGGKEGEGVVKPLRALLPNQLSDNFSSNLINAKFRQGMLDVFRGQFVPGLCDEDEQTEEIGDNMRRYSSKEEVLGFVKTGIPLSLVFVFLEGHTKFGPVVVNRGKWMVYPLVIMQHLHSQKFMFELFLLSFSEEQIPIKVDRESGLEPITYGFFLPKMPRSAEDTDFIGSIVTVEMQSLTPDGGFE
jgi:hypothetical protein